jgi:lipopolysaccharide export LptBFGC system permease protein LptF
MTRSESSRGQPGRVLPFLARRVASAAVCERVLVPLLADFHFEYQRATSPPARLLVRLVWTVAFGQALGLEAVCACTAHLRANAWGTTEEERSTTRRLLACIAAATIVIGAALMLDMAVRPVGRQFGHLALLLPSVLCAALPAAALFGVVLAERGRPSPAPRWRPILGVVAVAGLATFAVAAWITPKANQTYRESVFASLTAGEGQAGATPRPGDRELTLGELSARASELRRRGEGMAADGMDLEWHKKPALGASCLALALAAAAIARRIRRDGWRWLASIFVIAAWGWLLRAGEQAADAGAVAPALAMWGPCLVVAALGFGAFGHRSPPRTQPPERTLA